jgi:hypothetical protein
MKFSSNNNIRAKSSLTRPFHHDRGRIVFAVSPRRGEQAALGRRLRRGEQCYSGVINALRAWNEISLARVLDELLNE